MVGEVQSPSGLVHRSRGQSSGWSGLAHEAIAWVIALVDFVFLLAASATGFLLYEQITFGLIADPSRYVGIGLVIAMSFVLAMHSAQAYRPEKVLLLRHQIRLICILTPTTLAFLLTVIFFFKLGSSVSRGSILLTTIASLSGLIALRYFWRAFIPFALARGVFGRRRVLLICGDGFPVLQFQARAAGVGTTVTEVARLSEDGDVPLRCLDLLAGAPPAHIDEVVIVWRSADMTKLDDYLGRLRRSTLPVSVTFEGLVGGIVAGTLTKIGGMTAFQTQRPPLSLYESTLKRLFDICFSLTTLLALSPILLITAVAVKLDSKGPVFFRQTRKGYGGRPFRIVKFRSMTVMEDGDEVRQATRGDTRITRVGAFIRSTSLDELPQFWNVLKGEMSVVGPRPHANAHDEYFDAQIGEYVFRRHVKPGLTGWAQINKCRGETPDLKKMEERIFHDLWYINNWSLWLDLKIVCRTVCLFHDFRDVY